VTFRPKFKVVKVHVFSQEEGPRTIDVAVDVGNESVLIKFAERDGSGSAVTIARGRDARLASHGREVDD